MYFSELESFFATCELVSFVTQHLSSFVVSKFVGCKLLLTGWLQDDNLFIRPLQKSINSNRRNQPTLQEEVIRQPHEKLNVQPKRVTWFAPSRKSPKAPEIDRWWFFSTDSASAYPDKSRRKCIPFGHSFRCWFVPKKEAIETVKREHPWHQISVMRHFIARSDQRQSRCP